MNGAICSFTVPDGLPENLEITVIFTFRQKLMERILTLWISLNSYRKSRKAKIRRIGFSMREYKEEKGLRKREILAGLLAMALLLNGCNAGTTKESSTQSTSSGQPETEVSSEPLTEGTDASEEFAGISSCNIGDSVVNCCYSLLYRARRLWDMGRFEEGWEQGNKARNQLLEHMGKTRTYDVSEYDRFLIKAMIHRKEFSEAEALAEAMIERTDRFCHRFSKET